VPSVLHHPGRSSADRHRVCWPGRCSLGSGVFVSCEVGFSAADIMPPIATAAAPLPHPPLVPPLPRLPFKSGVAAGATEAAVGCQVERRRPAPVQGENP